MKNLISILILSLFFGLSNLANAESIDINTADAKTIAANTKGIGLIKATVIVNYREKNGVFNSIDDLSKVKGIGKKTIEKNRQNLMIVQETSE